MEYLRMVEVQQMESTLANWKLRIFKLKRAKNIMNISTREIERPETISNPTQFTLPHPLKISGPVPYRNLITMNILRRKRRSFRIFNASKFLFPTTTQIWVIMCYYVQRVSDHTEHRLAPISEASVLLQEYRCLFSMHFRRPMPIIEQKY